MPRHRKRQNPLLRFLVELPGTLIYYLTFQFLFVARDEESVPLIWRAFYLVAGPFVALYYFAFSLFPRVVLITWRTRILRNVLFGSPFIAVSIFSVYVGVNAANVDFVVLASKYETLSKSAVKSGDLEAARVYLERVLQLRGKDNEVIFELCKVARQRQDVEGYLTLLAQLAPDDEIGYGPAHLERAQYFLERPNRTADDVLNGEQQILFAYQVFPENAEVRRLLGDFYISLGQWKQAEEHLEYASKTLPGSLLTYAQVLAVLDKKDFAKQIATRSLNHHVEILEKNPGSKESRLGKAEAENFLELFPASIATLELGKSIESDPIYDIAMAKVLINWSDSLPSDTNEQKMTKFALLDKALKSNPSEPLVFDRVISLIKTDSNTASQIKSELEAAISNGKGAGMAHLILGTIEGEEGNAETAVTHLSMAYSIDSNSVIILNNLAWFLAHKQDPDLPRALRLVELVLSKWPNSAYVRDTRGQILLLMGEHERAFVDLQYALSELPNNADTHDSLGKIYEIRGLSSLASQHRAKASELRKSQLPESK